MTRRFGPLALVAILSLLSACGSEAPAAKSPAKAPVATPKVAPRPALPADPSRIQLDPAQGDAAFAMGGFARAPATLLRVDGPMEYGDFVWNDRGVPAGPISIRVDLRTQVMSVFRGPDEIGTAIVLYGADGKETPTGRFPILWKGKNHRSSLYDAPMPYTLRLTGDGIAIHGSNVRWGAATHGCIGIPSAFASRLFEEAKVGDTVTIVRTRGENSAAS